jgi:hypothetical protein
MTGDIVLGHLFVVVNEERGLPTTEDTKEQKVPTRRDKR